MTHPHNVRREGFITGVLGASAVAVWFLIVDWIAGMPLFTPAALGAALFRVEAETATVGTTIALVAGYTVFHYAAFVAVGLIAAFLVHAAEGEPALLALFFIFFVMFETGFYGLVAVLNAVQLLQGLEWYQIAIGNLLASICMGAYLWRSHPALRRDLTRALSH
jgi:hypothetical protein